MGRDGRGVFTPWAVQTAPTLAEFEDMALAAYRNLPDAFRALCDDLVISIAEFADDDALDSVGLDDPYSLLGLFQGHGMAQTGGMGWTGRMPNRVFLYRRPILDYWADGEDALGTIITHVLVHEIGHHFGLSDADMERIEASAE